MTMSNPEVLGYFVEWSCNSEEGDFKLSLDHFTTRGDYCSNFDEEECRLVPVVRLSDYEHLQLDRDQQYHMKVKAREQRDAVTAELKSLQAECEKLRKDAERYRWWREEAGGILTFDQIADTLVDPELMDIVTDRYLEV